MVNSERLCVATWPQHADRRRYKPLDPASPRLSSRRRNNLRRSVFGRKASEEIQETVACGDPKAHSFKPKGTKIEADARGGDGVIGDAGAAAPS